MRVLIAEDEFVFAFMIETALQQAGHEVVVMTSSADDALRKAECVDVDVALVDIHLRDGEDAGLKLAKALDDEFDVSSLIVSAQPEKAYAIENVALGFLAKPFKPRDIQKAVRAIKMLLSGDVPPPEMLPAKMELFPSHH